MLVLVGDDDDDERGEGDDRARRCLEDEEEASMQDPWPAQEKVAELQAARVEWHAD